MKIVNSNFLKFLPDKLYLKLKYLYFFHKRLNLKEPKTFNEKINWLKLNDRKDDYTKMVDKYEVKEYVSNRIGSDYIIPTIGVYEKFEDIDFEKLPNRFVIKCTHDSGGLVICKDKNNLDLELAKKKIKRCLKRNYYYHAREWPYKNVKHRIIIEKYMEDRKTLDLRDYKFFCFNGEPKLMFIAIDREKNDTKFNFYDMEFNLQPFMQHYPNCNEKIEKPINFYKMIELSKKLSKGIPFLRVDFYEVDGQVYFGELTFSHFSGMMPFNPEEWDEKIGNMLKLPKRRKK